MCSRDKITNLLQRQLVALVRINAMATHQTPDLLIELGLCLAAV
jgi:hypothetical protein